MAVLTWRNVEAPRGGDAGIAGLATAAGLLSKSTDGFSDALGRFGDAQTTLADNAAVQAASRYQTAEGLSGALSDGSLISGLTNLGVDPSRVNAATMGTIQKGVDDRVTNSLHSAEAQAHLAKAGADQFKLGVDVRNQSALSQAMPFMNEINLRRQQNNEAGALALENDPSIRPLLQAVDPKTYGEINAQGQEALSKTLGVDKSNFDLHSAIQDRQYGQLSDNAAQTAMSGAPTNNQGMYDRVRAMGLPPSVEAMTIQKINALKNYNISPGPIGSDVQGGTPGGGSAFGTGGNTNPMRLTLGGGQADPSINTVGDVVDNGKALASAHKTADGVGHSNVGPYQITAPTWGEFAPKALGDGWRNADINDYATHDRVGSAIWDTVKNDPSAMAGRWTSLSPAQANALKGADWKTAREVIAKGESSSSPAAILAASVRPAGAAAPAGSLAPGETDATPGAGPIQGTDPTTDPSPSPSPSQRETATLPSIGDLTKAVRDAQKSSLRVQSPAQQRGMQNLQAAGVDPDKYSAALKDSTSPFDVAKRLTGPPVKDKDGNLIAGEMQGEDPGDVQSMIEAMQQSSNGKDKSASAVGYLLAHGAGVLKSGGNWDRIRHNLPFVGHDTVSAGRVWDGRAANNLMGDINASGITQSGVDQLNNKQLSDAVTNAQKDFEDAAKEATAVNKAKMTRGVDPGVELATAQKYARAKARLEAAQQALNGDDTQMLGLPEAQAKKQAKQKAISDEQARRADLLSRMGDAPAYMGI